MNDIDVLIHRLLHYALRMDLIQARDLIYHRNQLLQLLHLDSWEAPTVADLPEESIEDILADFVQWASSKGLLPENPTTEEADLFDTKIIGSLVPMPSDVERTFWRYYDRSAICATDFYYQFSQNTNYIRRKRIEKDEKWSVDSPYGDIHISINLSKPEKDPRDIAKAKTMVSTNYPKCLLCIENENYTGRPSHPARGNHRIIGLSLCDEPWFLQYSPYVYYNEHCIVLKAAHEPMRLTKQTFLRMMDFLKYFPHYFIGSNADLPIVGGSILSHDHFQGGHYVFPMEVAKEIDTTSLSHHDASVSILHWPLSVLRLRGKNAGEIADLGYTILSRWQHYNDESAEIRSHSDGIPHNTVTPIARYKNGFYELDLALRNNRTSSDRPFGIFHPKESLHHIKKENIGLIEVMGLAILPARLKKEVTLIEKYVLENNPDAIRNSPELSKHADFADRILGNPSYDSSNIHRLILEEIGKVFVEVLEDAGVFKTNQEGLLAFRRAKEVLLENL